MKKLVIVFMSVLTSGLLLTSCSDDDGDSASIEGKWEFYEEGTSFGGQEELFLYEHTEGCEKDFIEVLSEGVYQDVFYYNDGEACSEDISTSTWSRSGNTITVTTGGASETYTILTLNSSTLKIALTSEFGGVTFSDITVFKRP